MVDMRDAQLPAGAVRAVAALRRCTLAPLLCSTSLMGVQAVPQAAGAADAPVPGPGGGERWVALCCRRLRCWKEQEQRGASDSFCTTMHGG